MMVTCWSTSDQLRMAKNLLPAATRKDQHAEEHDERDRREGERKGNPATAATASLPSLVEAAVIPDACRSPFPQWPNPRCRIHAAPLPVFPLGVLVNPPEFPWSSYGTGAGGERPRVG